MKTVIYFESAKALSKSGIGRALTHQKLASEKAGIDYSTNIKDYKDADVIHINTLYPKSYKVLKKMKKAGKPVIVHGHSTYEDFRNSFRCWKLMRPFMNHFITTMYSHADLIITPTPYSKGLIENYKCVSCPVLAISNGINLDEYARNEKYIQEFKDKFNIKEGQKVVIGIGWFFKRKGIDDFFEVARKMPDVTFIWFGHLSKIATQHKINKAIKNRPANVIMPGYIKGDIIKGAMQCSTCLLFPSYEETEGIVVLEAFASGLPIVVRDIGVYKDWLIDKVNCRKAIDNDGFVDCISDIINGDNTKMIANGYEIAKERSIDKIGNQLKAAYEQAIELNKKR